MIYSDSAVLDDLKDKVGFLNLRIVDIFDHKIISYRGLSYTLWDV